MIISSKRLPKDSLFLFLLFKLFFDAYIDRLSPDLHREMDAVIIRIEDAEKSDTLLKRTGELIEDILIKGKGLGCRRDDDLLCVFCAHKTNHEELMKNIAEGLAADGFGPVGLHAGVSAKVDKSAPADTWFRQAADALDSISADSERLTAQYAG